MKDIIKDIINFLGSNILDNIIGLIGLLITFFSVKKEINEKDEKHVSQVNDTRTSIYNSPGSSIQNTNINSTKYYFYDSSSTNSDYEDDLIIVIGLIFAFVLYAIFGKLFMTFLLLLIIALIIKYNCLGIANIKQILVPIAMLIVVLIMVNNSPEQFTKYWKQINFGKYPMTFSKIYQSLLGILLEVFMMAINHKKSSLLISIISNMVIILLILEFTINDLVKPKNKIMVQKWSVIVLYCFVLIFLLLKFYSVKLIPCL